MPTPDSIDRAKPQAPKATPTTPWETLFGVPSTITVYVNPITQQVKRVDDPAQVPALIAHGFMPATIPGAQMADFITKLGPNFEHVQGNAIPNFEIPSGYSAMTPADIAAANAEVGDINNAASAAQGNLKTAFDMSQVGRDRAVAITKENYKATEQPTLRAAAVSGAGYHQANGELFMGRVQRDRSLAEAADQNASAQFQFDLSRQQAEAQRQQQILAAWERAQQAVQGRTDSAYKSIFGWLG
jgi:hypothetical protein